MQFMMAEGVELDTPGLNGKTLQCDVLFITFKVPNQSTSSSMCKKQ